MPRASLAKHVVSSATTAASSSCRRLSPRTAATPRRTSTRASPCRETSSTTPSSPAASAVVGSALSVLDAANDTRHKLNASRGIHLPVVAPPKKSGIGAGGVIAIIFGVAAALGVLYAAWQTLRADDELWVADDPLRAPDA